MELFGHLSNVGLVLKCYSSILKRNFKLKFKFFKFLGNVNQNLIFYNFWPLIVNSHTIDDFRIKTKLKLPKLVRQSGRFTIWAQICQRIKQMKCCFIKLSLGEICVANVIFESNANE